MLRALLMLSVGAAALGAARFCKSAIADERQRRAERHETHEAHRWEGEGGQVVAPHTLSTAGAA